MIQQNACSNPIFTKFIVPDMTAIGTKNLETLTAVQKKLFIILRKFNRTWMIYLNEEAAVISNFTHKVLATRSIPDAAVAFFGAQPGGRMASMVSGSTDGRHIDNLDSQH